MQKTTQASDASLSSVAAAPAEEPLPERPLELLVAGGLLAAFTGAGMLAIAYRAWVSGAVARDSAVLFIGLLSFVFTAGVYMFAYGWERQDVARAVRLTGIVVFVCVGAVFIGLLVLAALSKMRGGLPGARREAGPAGGSRLGGLPFGLLASLGGELHAAPGADAADEDEETSDLFTITCARCRERFIPLPPAAICPNCGERAVTLG